MKHARSLVRRVCDIAGQVTWIDDLRDDAIETGLVAAVEDHDTAVIFDWLMRMLSFQGISDAVAEGYMDRHGNVTWAEIEASLATNPGCDKLQGYWAFTDCQYHKGFQTCAEPTNFPIAPCPGIHSETGGSTKLRTACSCSSGTLPVATSSGGLIGSSPTIPDPRTFRRPGPPWSTRCGMSMGSPTRSSPWRWHHC